MKSRKQLTQALGRAYKTEEAIRLDIGLGEVSEANYADLDAILEKIDKLNQAIADHDTRQSQWRSYHSRQLLSYCQAKRGLAVAG